MKTPPAKLAKFGSDPSGDEVPASAPLKKAKGKGKGKSGASGADLLSSRGPHSDGGTRAMLLAGSHPAAIALNGMATIEQNLKAMSRVLPNISLVAAPFLDQMKAAVAGGLSNLVSGGIGTTTAGPGGMGMGMGAAGGPASPPGPPGPPMGAPPPPPMMM